MADDEPEDLDFEDMEDIVEGLEEVEPEETTKESRAMAFLSMHHPECRIDYLENIMSLLPLEAYPPGELDKHHKSVPYLTLFEKTKLIGFRANQLAQGARPLVDVPAHVTDVIEIARIELEERRMPYILKRGMPDGTFEYWRLTDLLIL
jgi:DNA-directed RNA polymerase I, II, and III subunit RPABC2